MEPFTYKAKVIRVVDGDTFYADIDLGFGLVFHNQGIRLYEVSAPERGNPGAIDSTEALKRFVADKIIVLRTLKDRKEKYGRWLGVVYVDGENINERMVLDGFARKGSTKG